jgi:hypothetical protein
MNTEQEIATMKEELEELKRDLAEARKLGKDTKIAELIVMAIPSKLRYAEITGERKDIGKVKSLLKNARDEIESAEDV